MCRRQCFFRRQFPCGALLCNCSSAEREGLSAHVPRECSAESFMRSILSLIIVTSLPGSRLRFFTAVQKFSTLTSTPLYSSSRLYAQKTCVNMVQESVKVCAAGMSSRTLYAQHPVTEDIPISPRFSPTNFYHDATSVLLLLLIAHLCTAVIIIGSKRRTLCSKLFVRRA